MSGSNARTANERILIGLSPISHRRSIPSSEARGETRSRFPLAMPHISHAHACKGAAMMKPLKYLLVAAVAVPALAGPGFAQTSKPAAPPAAPAPAPAVTPRVTQDAVRVAG